ncbi:sentrin-specific protease 1-like isoform X3 [Penaeus japonicus]|uniref:sentrin-specific protease 1-like isoform X3 n=1 Tax=Penaeus japonicus TaxID=27405 RepID=UPI001C712BAD|nr:sentrin-specific protease 1-like isoform X3 [Penaeus japonicus]
MISAVTSKLKSILGANTYTTESRKRTLESSNEDQESGASMDEPVRKKSRSYEQVERSVNQSNTWYIGNLPKIFSGKAARVYTWITSFATFPAPAVDDSIDKMLPVVRYKLKEDRRMSGEDLRATRDTGRKERNPVTSGLFAEPSSAREEDEIQYLGMTSRLANTSAPTKRPALARRGTDIETPNAPPTSRGIGANFRFSPSITSTVSKQSSGSSSSLSGRSAREPNWFTKNSRLTSIDRKSISIAKNPVKNLHERCFGTKKRKASLNSSFFSRTKTSIPDSYRFEDKMRYQQLLQQFTDSPILPESYSVYKGSSSVSAASDSRCGSPQGFITRSRLNSSWTNEKRQQLEESESPVFTSSNFSAVYSARKSRTQERGENRSPSITFIDLVKPENENSNQSARESESDSVIITGEVKKPPTKSNTLEEHLQASPVYNLDWLKSMREKYEIRGKTREAEAIQAVKTREMFEEKRKAAQASLDERIARRMRDLDLTFPSKVEELEPEEEEEEEEELVALTPEMEEIIDDALKGRPPGEVLVEKFSIQITRKDIATLCGLNWLNDEVINFYMNLLVERGKNDNYPSVYAFNTFFYPKLVKTGYSTVRRWTKKVDVFSMDLLLVPVHLGMHWCLATMDFRSKSIRYYDSMLGDNERCLEALRRYLESEHEDKKKAKYDTNDWTLENMKDIPQQMNGSDCGMFACKFAEYLSRDATITFDQQHMPYFRRRMIYEIVKATLL